MVTRSSPATLLSAFVSAAEHWSSASGIHGAAIAAAMPLPAVPNNFRRLNLFFLV